MKKGLNKCMAALSLVLACTCSVPVSANYYDVDKNVTYKVNEDGSLSVDKTNSTTYRNKVTGETCVKDNKGKVVSGDYEKATTYEYYTDFVPQLDIGLDEDLDYSIPLRAGETLVGFAVTSGKKSLTITKCGESVSDASFLYDYDAKQNYIKRRDGSKDYVGTDKQAAALKLKRYTFRYRLFGKKAGKANLQIKIADRAGVVTTYNVKVIVSNDTREIKSVTYAGKELVPDLSKNGSYRKLLECQTTNKKGIKYTTKKSGKFKVKMGNRYRFVTAYVIKPNPYTSKTDTYKWGSSTETTTKLVRGYSKGIDLNGDGDFEDTIDGIDESRYAGYNCQKIKNNQKITLNKIPDQKKETSIEVYDRTQKAKNYSSYYKSNMARTEIVIVYQDKISKRFYNDSVGITLRVGKK